MLAELVAAFCIYMIGFVSGILVLPLAARALIQMMKRRMRVNYRNAQVQRTRRMRKTNGLERIRNINRNPIIYDRLTPNQKKKLRKKLRNKYNGTI